MLAASPAPALVLAVAVCSCSLRIEASSGGCEGPEAPRQEAQ